MRPIDWADRCPHCQRDVFREDDYEIISYKCDLQDNTTYEESCRMWEWEIECPLNKEGEREKYGIDDNHQTKA